ncbi:nucleoside recognition domain-containing protein [Marinomonas fungiae]|uniref:nucleoside recognition domain-containing protein n=1 Tax=Marinomonas fungiae TaxID=1137284 RepID=UPI003A91D9DE
MEIIEHMMSAGRLALDLSLYVILPITVVMGGLMKVLENKGVLGVISNLLTPVTKLFGATGLSIIGLAKMLFVSSVAPLTTLKKLDLQELDRRKLASSLALMLSLTQANVSFPLIAYGLDIGFVLISSLVGGVIASAVTYYLLTRNLSSDTVSDLTGNDSHGSTSASKDFFQSLNEGGMEGMKIAINTIPMLVITLFLLTVLKQIHVIEWLTGLLAPFFALIGLTDAAALPILTKYIAGGTAYLGVMVDQIEQGAINATDINIIAGIASNPVDLVGVALFSAIGPRISQVFRYALVGACFGLMVRAMLHIAWFA